LSEGPESEGYERTERKKKEGENVGTVDSESIVPRSLKARSTKKGTRGALRRRTPKRKKRPEMGIFSKLNSRKEESPSSTNVTWNKKSKICRVKIPDGPYQ